MTRMIQSSDDLQLKKKIGFAARQKLASRLPTKAVVSVTSPSSGGRVVEEHNTSLR